MLTSPTSPAAIHETGTLAPMDANILFRGREHRKQSIHAPSEPKQSRKPCVRQYERQKREKNALNQQIAELLECLEREKAHQKLRRESKMVSPRANSAWKMVAQRRLKRRVASESLQKWLQAAVTEMAAVIDELIELLRQHMRVATLIAAQSHGPYSDTVLQPTWGELLYGMYSSEIRGAYPQTDAVFSTSGLGYSEETLAFRRSLITDRGTDFIQFGWKNLFPFTFQRANESLWMLAHLVDRQEARESYDVVDDPDNTIALKFRVIGRQVDGTSESLIHRLLGRRFNEANRVIHVWKSSTIGDGQYRGMQIDETGWRIIQPSTSGTGTMTQVCVRQLPLHRFSAHTPPASTAQQFEEFVQNMVLENCQEATKVLKTLLLDDALARIYFNSTQL